MKQCHYCFFRISKTLKSIHLVDKCLILFMLVLLIQLSFSMFIQAPTSSEINYIDIVVRTSAASIFGYFLSANFIRHSSSSKEVEVHATQLDETSQVKENPFPTQEESQKDLPSASRVQIVVATVIGLTCLISLLLLRNLAALNEDIKYNPSIAATVAQFRDFISGCVGFLIGCPTNPQK